MFTGTYICKLDNKGRFKIPKRYKEFLAENAEDKGLLFFAVAGCKNPAFCLDLFVAVIDRDYTRILVIVVCIRVDVPQQGHSEGNRESIITRVPAPFVLHRKSSSYSRLLFSKIVPFTFTVPALGFADTYRVKLMGAELRQNLCIIDYDIEQPTILIVLDMRDNHISLVAEDFTTRHQVKFFNEGQVVQACL